MKKIRLRKDKDNGVPIQVLMLIQAYRQLFERLPPDLWITITFRKHTSLGFTIKRLKRFFASLNTPVEMFYHHYLKCWVYFEKTSEGYHIHCLLKGISPNLALNLEERCLRYFGRSEVRPYDRNITDVPASEYVGKKCVKKKDTQDYWDYYKINSRYRCKGYKRFNKTGSVSAPKPPLNLGSSGLEGLSKVEPISTKV
jgi:hypothetical protein